MFFLTSPRSLGPAGTTGQKSLCTRSPVSTTPTISCPGSRASPSCPTPPTVRRPDELSAKNLPITLCKCPSPASLAQKERSSGHCCCPHTHLAQFHPLPVKAFYFSVLTCHLPARLPQRGHLLATRPHSEHVLDIVSKAKTNLFNFSSLFVDESENDAEPNFKPPPTYGPPVGKGYVVYQTSLPVLPIHYVNQQNGRYSGAGPRATHRILFPSSTPTTYPSPQSTSVQGRHRIRQESSSYSDPYNLPPPPPPPPPPSAASPSSTWKPMYPLTTSSELTNYGGPSTGSSGSGVKGVQSSVHHRSPSVASSSVPPEEPFRQEKMNTGRLKRQANGNGGNEDEVESICKTQMQFISPKVALNDRAEWKYIVNLGDRDPRLRQIIKVDVCS